MRESQWETGCAELGYTNTATCQKIVTETTRVSQRQSKAALCEALKAKKYPNWIRKE